LLHNHPHLSGAGTIGQKWPQYKGLSPTPLAIKKNNNSDARITIGGNISKSFNVLEAARHGAGLSAVLFNLAVDKLSIEFRLNWKFPSVH
jgi:hypothetical protein